MKIIDHRELFWLFQQSSSDFLCKKQSLTPPGAAGHPPKLFVGQIPTKPPVIVGLVGKYHNCYLRA